MWAKLTSGDSLNGDLVDVTLHVASPVVGDLLKAIDSSFPEKFAHVRRLHEIPVYAQVSRGNEMVSTRMEERDPIGRLGEDPQNPVTIEIPKNKRVSEPLASSYSSPPSMMDQEAPTLEATTPKQLVRGSLVLKEGEDEKEDALLRLVRQPQQTIASSQQGNHEFTSKQLTEALELELASENYTCSRICPGDTAIPLQGREEALGQIEDCFSQILARSNGDAPVKAVLELPVCCGPRGIGKTRMLQEGANLLIRRFDLPNVRIALTSMKYKSTFFDESGCSLEAVLAWRILTSLLQHPTSNMFSQVQARLRLRDRMLGSSLTLSMALDLVERWWTVATDNYQRMHLFVGVDDCCRSATDAHDVQTLISEIARVAQDRAAHGSATVIFPMFTASASEYVLLSEKSASYVTTRLEMPFLTPRQGFAIAESSDLFLRHLRFENVCRYVYYLSSVPGWIVLFVYKTTEPLNLGAASDMFPHIQTLEGFSKNFTEVFSEVSSTTGDLSAHEVTRIAAFAALQRPVSLHEMSGFSYTWGKLSDRGICALRRWSTDGEWIVEVSSALYATLWKRCIPTTRSAEYALFMAFSQLDKFTSSELCYQNVPLFFSALLYAVRINSFLALGEQTISLGQLFEGAAMDESLRDMNVELNPTEMVWARDANNMLKRYVQTHTNQSILLERWASESVIVIDNTADGAESAYFTLREVSSGAMIVVLDQRKQVSNQGESVQELPELVQVAGKRVVRVQMCGVNASSSSPISHDTIFVPISKKDRFFAGLSRHPGFLQRSVVGIEHHYALEELSYQGIKPPISPGAMEVVMSPARLMAMFEADMISENEICTNPHVLDASVLSVPLAGREQAIDEIEMCFQGLIGGTAYCVPVCSGMPGIGKSRMLEEGVGILRDKMKLPNVYGVIIDYSVGWWIHPTEAICQLKLRFPGDYYTTSFFVGIVNGACSNGLKPAYRRMPAR